MDLQAKSWLEKAKRLNFSVWVMLRSDSSDELTNSDLRFLCNLLIVRWICSKEKNGDEKVLEPTFLPTYLQKRRRSIYLTLKTNAKAKTSTSVMNKVACLSLATYLSTYKTVCLSACLFFHLASFTNDLFWKERKRILMTFENISSTKTLQYIY
jgi:hypothetical protein